MISEINPLQAWEILNSDKPSVLIDVRSKIEYEYVGHPLPSINIPWQEPPDWRVDPDFVAKVRKQLEPTGGQAVPAEAMTVLTICRSGKRSMAAGIQLAENGFDKVINVAEGFEGDLDSNGHRGTSGGWRYHKLPWKQG